jgi:hypothetical protein
MSTSDTMSNLSAKNVADMVERICEPGSKAEQDVMERNNGGFKLKPADVARNFEGSDYSNCYFSNLCGKGVFSIGLREARKKISGRNSRSGHRQGQDRRDVIDGSTHYEDDFSEISSGSSAVGMKNSSFDFNSFKPHINLSSFNDDDGAGSGSEMSWSFAATEMKSNHDGDMSIDTAAMSNNEDMSIDSRKSLVAVASTASLARASSAKFHLPLNPIFEETKDDASETRDDQLSSRVFILMKNTLIIERDPHLEENHKEWMYNFISKEFVLDLSIPKTIDIIEKLQEKTKLISALSRYDGLSFRDVEKNFIEEKKKIINDAVGSIRSGSG